MTHRLLAAALAVAVTLGAPAAWAQRGDDWTPRKQGHRLAGRFVIWPSDSHFSQSGEFVAQIAVIDELMIDVAAPAGYATIDVGPGDDVDHAVFGNPYAGAHWGDTLPRGFSMWAGGTVTFPVLFDPGFERGFASTVLAVDRGLIDLDRFLFEYLTVRPRVGLEAHFADYFFVSADLGFPLFIDVSGDRRDSVEFAYEQGAEFEARAPVGVGGGVRLQIVIITDDYGFYNDEFQAVIEPFFVYEPFERLGFFARVGFPLALDRPLGFGFDRNGLAAVQVTLGGKW